MSSQSRTTPAPAQTAPAPTSTAPVSTGPGNAAEFEQLAESGTMDESWWSALLGAGIKRVEEDLKSVAPASMRDWAETEAAIDEGPSSHVDPATGATVDSTPDGTTTTATDGTRTTETNTSNTEKGTTTTTIGRRTEVVDGEATSEKVREEFNAHAKLLEEQADAAGADAEEARGELAALRDERESRSQDLEADNSELDAQIRAAESAAGEAESLEVAKHKAAARARAEAEATTADNALEQGDKLPGGVDPVRVTVDGTEETVQSKPGRWEFNGTWSKKDGTEVRKTTDGETRVEGNASETKVDLANGTYADTHTTTTGTKSADGSSDTTKSTESNTIELDDGVKRTRGTSTERVVIDGKGTETTTKNDKSAHGKVIWSDDEVGLGGGVERSTSTTTKTTSEGKYGEEQIDTTSTSGKVAASGQVTTKGAQGEVGGDVDIGPVTAGVRGYGGFTLDLKETPIGSGTYSVIATVTAGVKRNLGAGGEKLGLEGHGDRSGAVTFSRTLSEDALKAYLAEAAEVDETGETSSDRPEFVMVANWRAGLDAAADGGVEALIGGLGPDATANLRPGDSVETVVTTKDGVSGKASAGPVGGQAAYDVTFSRSVKVAPIDTEAGRRMQIVVTVLEGSKTSGTLEVAPGPINECDIKEGETPEGETPKPVELKAGVSAHSSSSSSEAVTFTLDPNSERYDADYRRILDADSKDALLALWESLGGSRTEEDTEGRGHGAEVGLAGGKATVAFEETQKSTVIHGEDGSSGVFEGGQTDAGSLEAGDLKVGQSTETKVAATVDQDGETGMQFQQKTDTTGFGAPDFSDATPAGLKKLLAKALTEEWSRLSTFDLSESEVRRMYALTGDADRWVNSAQDTTVSPDWEALRSAIMSPSPEPEWVEHAPDIANDLARAQAVSAFMAATGAKGLQTVKNLFRGTGVWSSGGTLAEFPPEIVGERPKYEALLGNQESLRATVQGYIDTESAQAGADWLGELDTEARRLLGVIDGCTDFQDPRAKAEMQGELYDFLEALVPEYAALAETGDVDHLDHMDGQAIALAQLSLKIEELEANRRIHDQLTDQMKAWADSWNFMDNTTDEQILDGAIQLTKHWVPLCKQVYDDSARLGVPQDQWAVTRDVNNPNPRTEPDWKELIAIYSEHNTTGPGSPVHWLKNYL